MERGCLYQRTAPVIIALWCEVLCAVVWFFRVRGLFVPACAAGYELLPQMLLFVSAEKATNKATLALLL